MVRILSTLIPADAGSMRIAGHDVVGDPDGVRAAIGVTGQFSAVDDLLTGAENLRLMADLHHLGRDAGRRRVAELLEQFDLADAADKPAVDLLGRDAAPARPGHDPGRRAAGDLPRRAHHRPGPAQPPHHVADHPRARRRRRHDPAHHPVPRRGRPAGRPDRGPRPGPDRRRRHPGRAQAPHPRRPRPAPLRRPGCRCARPPGCSAAARATRTSSSCRSPSDGSVASLRALLDELDEPASSVERLSIHTPDLDDVFFAVTGSHVDPSQGGSRVMTTLAYTVSDSADDAAPQPPAPAPLPVDDPDARRHADRVPAAVRLRLRRPARRRPRRGRRGTRRAATSTTSCPASADDRGRRRPGHRDHGRHGHDRRHHRPVPHHGHRPGVGPHRPRARQPDPDPGRHRRPHRGRLRARVPPHRRAARTGWPRSGAGPVRLRADLAGRRARAGRQERRDRQQHPDVPDPAALPRQRLRAHRHHAGRAAPVRRVPAVHPRHRDRARPAHRRRRSAATPSPPSPGASASPSPPTSGPHLYNHRSAN